MKYRKKPVVVEAFRLTEENYHEPEQWPEWAQENYAYEINDHDSKIWHSRGRRRQVIIRCFGDDVEAENGDWIIRGVDGEIYPCKHSIFVKTYEPVVNEEDK